MNWKTQVDEFKKAMKPETTCISTQAIRFGFFGTVGAGKSVTAGIFAIGITPKGLIGWVDGEGHRSGWAIDIVAEMAAAKYGGTKKSWEDRFRVIHIDPPFNPLRVVAAIEVLEEMGCKTIALDVLSQAWDSDGGYLDLKNEELDRMAGEDDAKRNRAAASAAAHVKPWTHGKLVNKITNSKTNLILLFQAKQKFNAKTSKPDDFQSPIQESGLTRTAIAVGLVASNAQGVGGFCSFELPQGQGTKFTHHAILGALPRNGEQFQFEHGEAILKLCGGAPAAAAPTQKELKSKLWRIAEPYHKGVAKDLEIMLRQEAFIAAEEIMADLTVERLAQVIENVEAKIAAEPTPQTP